MQNMLMTRMGSLLATVSCSAMLIGADAAAAQTVPAPSTPPSATTAPPGAASAPGDQIAPDTTAQAPATDAGPDAGPDAAPTSAVTDEQSGEIVVTGFRSSLHRALNIKKTEAGAVDAILA